MENPERSAQVETKKSRIWNPALDPDEPPKKLHKDKLESPNLQNPPFAPLMQPFLNLFLENYMQSIQPLTWKMHQVQQVNPRSHPAAKTKAPPQNKKPPSDSEASTSCSPSTPVPNPLVASALGLPASGIENSCAICGAAFRLTTDLVAHMRANHRQCRFKRKNEK